MDPSLKRDYVEVFSSSPGQRVLEDLCAKLGLSSSSFIVGDSHRTAFQEGKRHAALLIIDAIESPALALIVKKYKTNQRNLNV